MQQQELSYLELKKFCRNERKHTAHKIRRK
ncbi:MAG: 50S ribosomal protein L33 [Planctomycetota bacterium]